MNPLQAETIPQEFRENPESLMRLLHCFISETQRDLNRLRAALEGGDSSGTALHAHRIKGAAGAIGAEPLRAEAARIEAHGRCGELGSAMAAADNLQLEFDRYREFVTDLARNG